MKVKIKSSLIALGFLLLTACNSGPDYKTYKQVCSSLYPNAQTRALHIMPTCGNHWYSLCSGDEIVICQRLNSGEWQSVKYWNLTEISDARSDASSKAAGSLMLGTGVMVGAMNMATRN